MVVSSLVFPHPTPHISQILSRSKPPGNVNGRRKKKEKTLKKGLLSLAKGRGKSSLERQKTTGQYLYPRQTSQKSCGCTPTCTTKGQGGRLDYHSLPSPDWNEVLSTLIMVTISQYMHLSNHYVYDLNIIHCYISIISQFLKMQKVEEYAK